MGSEFKNQLENLLEKRFDISKVLKTSTETFEKYFQDGFTEEFSWFNLNTFPDLRLDNLDSLLDKLKSSLKLTSPCVEEANEMVSKLNLLNSKVETIRDKMKNISVTKDFSQLCDLERRINDNYSKLRCVQKLKTHLNPSTLDGFRVDLRDDEYDEFVKLVQSAESLKKSREFCYSLKNMEDLSDSPSLLEALKKIDDNFEKISEMCYLWLIKSAKRISALSSTLVPDSGIINEPLINVSDKDDIIGIASLFEINVTTVVDSLDKHAESALDDQKTLDQSVDGIHTNGPESNGIYTLESGTDDREGFEQDLGGKHTSEIEMDGRDLSLRMLKLLILNPKCLEMFLNEINDFLSELSYRRFSLLLQYIKMDMKYKNNAIYDLFMNLQLVLTLIKSCVISLYHNCELNLYTNPYLDLEIQSAPKYIDKIAEKLVSPLENKLESILNMVGMDDASESMRAEADFFSLRSQTSFDTCSDQDALEVESAQDIHVSDILDLYAAVQICNFYYNKIMNILKPPYLHPHSTAEDEEGTFEMDYVVENSPILQSFTAMCERWNNLIINKLQQNITVPLSDEKTSRSLNADMVVSTVSSFLSEIVSIQLEYSASDDLLAILQMTLNPVINWCQKVSKRLGNRSCFFLISSFSTLLNSIQSPFVNNTFKLLLEDLIDNNVELLSHSIIDPVIVKLGGKLVQMSPVSVEFSGDEFLENIEKLVYTSSLLEYLPPELREHFSDLDTSNARLIYKRVYSFMAIVYKEYSNDTQKASELLALASSYE